MPDYSSNDIGGAYTMNRTRLFYQDQYAAELPNTTVDMSRTSTTAASSHLYSEGIRMPVDAYFGLDDGSSKHHHHQPRGF